MSINIENVSKNFGNFKALDSINLEIPTGELVALLGPSGSGKTTLLRIIAGLETEESGNILFYGINATKQSVRDRNVGFVFQHYALFRHMTVFENIAFGLRVRPRKERPSKAEISERVYDLLRLVQLEGLAKRYPMQLSGGQRQRVALARALAVQPKVLLLDEPFGALDARVRTELRRWLRRLHDELKITGVFVTHDQEEALEVADRVVVMNSGKIEQVGTPAEVYDHPATPFVYNFLGNVNLFHGRVHEGKIHLGPLEVEAADAKQGNGSTIGYVRAHDLDIERTARDKSALTAVVKHIYAIGSSVRVELALAQGNDPVEALISRERYEELALATGEKVFLTPRKVKFFVEDYQI